MILPPHSASRARWPAPLFRHESDEAASPLPRLASSPCLPGEWLDIAWLASADAEAALRLFERLPVPLEPEAAAIHAQMHGLLVQMRLCGEEEQARIEELPQPELRAAGPEAGADPSPDLLDRLDRDAVALEALAWLRSHRALEETTARLASGGVDDDGPNDLEHGFKHDFEQELAEGLETCRAVAAVLAASGVPPEAGSLTMEAWAREAVARAGLAVDLPGQSVCDLLASEGTRSLREAFESPWKACQREQLASWEKHLWTLLAGALGQLSGTGQGALAGRLTAAALGACFPGAPVASAAVAAVVAMAVASVLHTVVSDPLQAMVRATTVSNPHADRDLRRYQWKARALKERTRERRGEPPKERSVTLGRARGLEESLTAAQCLERTGHEEGPDRWGRARTESLPYLVGDGLVGAVLRPLSLLGSSEEALDSVGGRLCEGVLHLAVFGPAAGLLNHFVSQCLRRSGLGRLTLARQQLSLAGDPASQAHWNAQASRLESDLRVARAIAEDPGRSETERRAAAADVEDLLGNGAVEAVTMPAELRRSQARWLESYANDLHEAIANLNRALGRVRLEAVADHLGRQVVLLQVEQERVLADLEEARAKGGGVVSHLRYRQSILFQRKEVLVPDELEKPAHRGLTASTITGKAIAMLLQGVAQVLAKEFPQGGQNGPALERMASGMAFVAGWMLRDDLAGGVMQAVAYSQAVRAPGGGEVRLDDVVVEVPLV